MSIIGVQLGQCGNTVGQAIYSSLFAHGQGSGDLENDVFFRSCASKKANKQGPVARAVLLDMEPKVIGALVGGGAGKTGWSYDPVGQFSRQSGSGNNWALGYHGHGPAVAAQVEDLVAREAERADSVRGFLVSLSLAGGTGSGLGSYVSELLRDAYPHSLLVHNAVGPHASGEVIVHGYNSVLTLSTLLQCSDSIVLSSNDSAAHVCRALKKIDHPSLGDLNTVIASQWAALLLPSTTASGAGRVLLDDMVAHVSPCPAFKLLTTAGVPHVPDRAVAFDSNSWHALLRPLRQLMVAGAATEDRINWAVKPSPETAMLGSWLVLRGEGAAQTDVDHFRDAALYSSWRAERAFGWSSSSVCFERHERCASALINSKAVAGPLDAMLSSAAVMRASGAYLHHYAKHGVTEHDFDHHSAMLEQALKDYKDAR